MESLGLYLLKSAVWLTGFTLVFLMVLRNERYFRLNRIYLLSGIVASIVFPFYTWHYAVISPSVQASFTTTADFSAVATVVPVSITIPFYWWLYLVGMVSIAIRLIWQTGMVVRKLRKTGYVKTGSVKLVRTSEYDGSFSFFSFVFVNPSITDIETKEIVNHEREHIQQRHWFDLLLVELLCMLQWFNPFIWIYARLIRQNHEYLADEMALQHTSNPAIYQATLLNQMLGVPVISLANSFSYSLNKKRFKMMKKKIDSPFRKLRMLLVLPLVAMVFYAFAKPEYITPTNAFPTDNVNVSVDGNVVKGKVVKTDGKPLYGTTVIIKDTTIGVITNKDGEFRLKSVSKDAELVFSFVGFKTVIQKPDFNHPMTITMVTDTVKFENGVVAVGYGPKPSAKANASSNADEIINSSNNPPPLFIVDGKIIDKVKFDKINTADFESIDVLKDKSATDKYGEKGKYGVLLITMKKPHSGTTPAPQFQTISPIKFSDINPENTPLIYLDNVIIDKAKLEAINPESIGSVEVLKGQAYIDRDGEKAKNGIIILTSKKKEAQNNQSREKARYFADGVEITKDEAGKIDPSRIDSMNVLKGENAVKKYGEKGRDGVVEIKLKSANGANAGVSKGLNDVKVVGYGNNPKQKNEKEVFVVVEQMPEFPGGDQACKDFIARTLKYPSEAMKKGIVGKVLVAFLVNKDGKIEKAKVVMGADPALNTEAVRVVSSMPDWKPGKQRGKAVDVVYTMPIEFMLQ